MGLMECDPGGLMRQIGLSPPFSQEMELSKRGKRGTIEKRRRKDENDSFFTMVSALKAESMHNS